MNPILAAAVDLQKFFVERKWPFCFIGGISVLRWGLPRTTQDVDASLFVNFGDEKKIVGEILKTFASRIENAEQFALDSRVVLVKSSNNIAYDIALAQFPFEKEIIERATYFEFGVNINLLTISAEDLVVLKSFAGRDQDWNDVRGIIAAQDKLDADSIRKQLQMLTDLQQGNPALKKLEQLLE